MGKKYNDWTSEEDEAMLNIIGGTEIARAVLRGERKLTIEEVLQEPKPGLLTLAGTITVRPAPNFDADEFFNTKNSSVNIAYVGYDFTALLLGKTESPNANSVSDAGPYKTPGQNGASEVVLCYYTLNEDSVDDPIIAELGGKAKVEITLVEIAACMTKKANGDSGALLSDCVNVFYVCGCAVGVGWYGGGWYVDAGSVEDPSEWCAGDRVFSRDS